MASHHDRCHKRNEFSVNETLQLAGHSDNLFCPHDTCDSLSRCDSSLRVACTETRAKAFFGSSVGGGFDSHPE